MTLPAQIREQVKAATELREQAYGGASNEDANKPESETTAAVDTPQPEVVAPATESTAEVRTLEKPATPAAEDENSQTYAQRWRSLQGVHNAMLQRVQGLEQLIATMQQPAPQQRQVEQAPSKLITPKDEDEFGTDMVDFARRVTREEMTPVMQALSQVQAQLAQLGNLAPAVQQVANTQAATAEEKFFAQLATSVPDWDRVNDDPRFHTWLLTPDEMTGITRQTYLDDARNNLDLRRVVSVFNTWKRETGVAPTAGTPQQATQQSNVSKLERQIAPGRSNAATSTPVQKAEKMWTPADIAKFFDDKRNGKYKGREAEASAAERDIFQAQREGRIRLAA
jgi:hypothetical protein